MTIYMNQDLPTSNKEKLFLRKYLNENSAQTSEYAKYISPEKGIKCLSAVANNK